ncbi:hypothetical protein [Nocardia carnea]|uniref:Type VII secretion-associated protein n=1 Tax=Nocardia carnea TaxID=37328 RepID=A0ABW7TPY4_9NOCA|nr:hypothetical protein [Nocardia carnea]
MVRVGAVHLGWDVVSVAAGGSGVPIRPVQVEGSYNPPAYLLADASGKLYTAAAGRQRPDLGMAIPDVREILGHPQIVIAGATWPAELVFRARLYNPLASVGTHLRGKPDVVALPYPDDWPDPKIDAYARLVEQLDVEVEPIPESIALSGYVRALGLVRAPDHRLPDGLGATAVHFDGQVVDGRANVLVVAVHGDEERPTESVYVPIDPESTRDPRIADDTVIEVMAAARAIGADNSTVLLAGQVVFNETLRFAFRNHLGQRLKKAEHPMHALVLGATHLLVSENEDDDEEGDSAGYLQTAPPARPNMPGPRDGAPGRADEAPGSPGRNPAAGPHPHPSAVGPGPHGPVSEYATIQVGRGDVPPGKGKLWNKMKDNLFGVPAVLGVAALAAAGVVAGSATAQAQIAPPGVVVPAGHKVDTSSEHRAAACVPMPRVLVEPPDQAGVAPLERPLYAQAPAPGAGESAPGPEAPADDGAECGRSGIDTLRYLVPGRPGVTDPGPPFDI